MVILTMVVLGLSGLCLMVALINAWSAPRLDRQELPPNPTDEWVSVLIPARNEALHLRNLLPRLLASREVHLEILVLDDHSEDETWSVTGDYPVRRLRGKPLPSGWTGKNWACHQLASAARGEVLLFMDADVLPEPLAVARSLSLLNRYHACALSVFPRQLYRHWSHWAVIPFVMELPLTGWIPLGLVHRTRAPSLVAANGQWFMIRAETYRQVGGHARIASAILEDMELARLLKTEVPSPFTSALGTRDVAVAMYEGFGDLRDGFTKNLFLLCGGTFSRFAVAIALFATLFAGPLFLEFEAAAIALSLVITWRLVSAAMFNSPWPAIVFHPVGFVLTVWIALRSAWFHRRGHVYWKGRSLPSPVA